MFALKTDDFGICRFVHTFAVEKHPQMLTIIWKACTAVSKALSNVTLKQMAHKNMHVLGIFGSTIPRNILETNLEIRKASL